MPEERRRDSRPPAGGPGDDRGGSDSRERSDGRPPRRGGGGGFRGRRPFPVSPFRENRVDGHQIDLTIDYKNIDLLKRCLNQASKMLPRRQTTLDAKRQRRLSRELKRARYLALLPYVNRGGN